MNQYTSEYQCLTYRSVAELRFVARAILPTIFDIPTKPTTVARQDKTQYAQKYIVQHLVHRRPLLQDVMAKQEA